jgi:hypothetical protein
MNAITTNTSFIQAPFNLVTSVNGSSKVELSWVDNSDNENGFEIQKALKGSGSFTTLTTVAADEVSYVDTETLDNYVY